MRTKKAALNSVTALILQITTVICGFILPRLVLNSFGSASNGLISSISQFIGSIALLRAGVGGVTRAALYKPLAKNDIIKISGIVKATEIFMRKIALFFSIFVIVFAALYPLLVIGEFEWFFSFSLVLIISFGTIIQYTMGLTYQILINADQRQYIISILNIVTTVLNTVLAVVLINTGNSIHVVKLGSTIVFLLNPLFLYFYARKRYRIVCDIAPDNSAIKQRYDALLHQIAAFVMKNTDVMVITIFCSIKEVSVYAVYNLVTLSMRRIILALSGGMDAALGNMMAKDTSKTVIKNFAAFELLIHIVSTIIFCSAGSLILSFVSIYTHSIKDVEYFQPVFAYCMVVAEFLYCIRIPYQTITEAAGHFKQTRNGAAIESIINIAISVILVTRIGIIGVAIGTILALLFRTVQYGYYMSMNLLHRPLKQLIIRFAVTLLNITTVLITYNLLPSPVIKTYPAWIARAIFIFLLTFGITAGINYLIFRNELMLIIRKTSSLFTKSTKHRKYK